MWFKRKDKVTHWWRWVTHISVRWLTPCDRICQVCQLFHWPSGLLSWNQNLLLAAKHSSNGNCEEVSLLNEWILYVVRSLVLSSTVLGAQRQAKWRPLICIAVYSTRLWGTWQGITQFYLPPTRLPTNGMSLACLYCPGTHKAASHLVWQPFPVWLRLGGWVGLGLWFLTSYVRCCMVSWWRCWQK